ncbi:MAG TPA: SRPBCC family protein [Allosphingosinicella sp.]
MPAPPFLDRRRPLSRWTYLAIALPLVLSQHLLVALAFGGEGMPGLRSPEFWAFPFRALTSHPNLSPIAAALAFAFALGIAWALAELSFRRCVGGWTADMAALALLPPLQIPLVLLLALLPAPLGGADIDDADERDSVQSAHHAVQGVLAGAAIIVFAVLVSAVTFGAYGWGLFVLTPFTMGLTTAYIANRRHPLPKGHTLPLVLGAAALGSFALILFALEGLFCILLAAPLGAAVAALGGALGRAAALAGHRRGRPFLAVGLLPAIFALEAAMPPEAVIRTAESIEIAAPAGQVWAALTSSEPIAAPPGWVGRAGLAYALGGRIVEPAVGGDREGRFSTGVAHERITAWQPGRRLAFALVSQPPAMEEMSPYRRVHAPHVQGYFDTGETRFDLAALPGGRTRLTITASHVLRLDPVLYWQPLARWAIRSNARRVLGDIRNRAEAASARLARRG